MTSIATALSLFLLLLCHSAAHRPFIALQCPEEDYPQESNYSSNLRRLLQRVYEKGWISFFYNFTEGDPPDTVYGHFLCRPDVPADVCLSCIDFGSSYVLTVCSGRKEAIIWYDECLLRYSNRSFFSFMESAPSNKSSIKAESSYPDVVGTNSAHLLNNVTELVIASDFFYAASNLIMSSSIELHVRAQCTPDLTRPDCRNCLEVATRDFEMFAINQFSQVNLPSCYAQYKIYDPTSQAPSPGYTTDRTINTNSDGRKKTSTWKWVLTVAISGCFVLTIFAGSFIGARIILKIRDERETEKKLWSNDVWKDNRFDITNNKIPGEKPVKYPGMNLMRLNVIRKATNNFSDDCKLGRGGFGLVYKGTLADGREIAVKRLSRSSGQGLVEWKNEVTYRTASTSESRKAVRMLSRGTGKAIDI
ncbi:hypothetical protein MLD38_037195 [Melastoma candidum]|uniref:Uncharacterized protein n=1 Tax=Melastoma candidum TaxID=119954 RepID=A0ACB9LM43_9MYRT|nr:hypothetical protein MLD38_037195 [Melastoma candidum]